MTNSTPDSTVLTDEAIAEIETVNKTYRVDWRYPNQRERVAALCATVKQLRELAYLPKILPDDDEVTYQSQGEQLLREKVDLQSQLEQLRAENQQSFGCQHCSCTCDNCAPCGEKL